MIEKIKEAKEKITKKNARVELDFSEQPVSVSIEDNKITICKNNICETIVEQEHHTILIYKIIYMNDKGTIYMKDIYLARIEKGFIPHISRINLTNVGDIIFTQLYL